MTTARELAAYLIELFEGRRLKVYLDSQGIPTVGRGHRVVAADGLKVGDEITPEREEAFLPGRPQHRPPSDARPRGTMEAVSAGCALVTGIQQRGETIPARDNAERAPDVESFARLCGWMGIAPSFFFRKGEDA